MDQLAKFHILAKKEYTGLKLGLARIKRVLKKLGNPENSFLTIHIAGTNGKGSVAVMMNSMLIASRLKVGLYTSPHFLDCKERILFHNKPISQKKFALLVGEVFSASEAVNTELTYFEILTVVACKYFAEKKIDVLVAETGLGGRMDATNAICNKIACIITSIDYDHMEILGRSIDKIAREKAGIIKRGVPVITYTGHKTADAVVKKVAQEKKAPLFLLQRDFYGVFHKFMWLKRGLLFSYFGIYSDYENLYLNLLGLHQIRNASLAIACMEVLEQLFNADRFSRKFTQRNVFDFCKTAISKKMPIMEQHKFHLKQDNIIRNGLSFVCWPGRFEILRAKMKGLSRTVILDGAHNAAGAKIFVETFLASPYAKKKSMLVMSVVRDKDYRAMVKIFSSVASKVVLFPLASSRALDMAILRKEWEKYLSLEDIFVVSDIALLQEALLPCDKVVCVSGSLYAVASFKKFCMGQSLCINL